MEAAAEAERGNFAAFRSTIRSISDDHFQAAKAEIASQGILKHLELFFHTIFQELVDLLMTAETLGGVNSQTLDTTVSMGEILSCRFVTALLQDRGISAKFVDLSRIQPVQALDGMDQSH